MQRGLEKPTERPGLLRTTVCVGKGVKREKTEVEDRFTLRDEREAAQEKGRLEAFAKLCRAWSVCCIVRVRVRWITMSAGLSTVLRCHLVKFQRTIDIEG